jgi:hypothetical protein
MSSDVEAGVIVRDLIFLTWGTGLRLDSPARISLDESKPPPGSTTAHVVGFWTANDVHHVERYDGKRRDDGTGQPGPLIRRRLPVKQTEMQIETKPLRPNEFCNPSSMVPA